MFLVIGRTCLRQPLARLRPSSQYRNIQQATRQFHRNRSGRGGGGWRQWQFKAPPQTKGLLLAVAASLSPAAFVRLSEKDNGGTEMTAEMRMLEASREEISKKVGDDTHGLQRVKDSIIYFLDAYLWEPLCTSIRFLHLVVIFVPVIITIPAAYFGPRDKARDNERAGTLWWYRFLVKAMERAGPAFIKVCHLIPRLDFTDFLAWAMGGF